MKKVFYYILGWFMIIFSIFWYLSWNFNNFEFLGFLFPFLSLTTGIIYLYLGKKQGTNLLTKISMISSVLIIVGVIYEMIFLNLLFPSGGYAEFNLPTFSYSATNYIHLFDILLVISFIFVIIGLVIYKNKE